MLSAARSITRKISNLYKREILRDKFLLNAKRWFSDRGDETHRLNYSLNEQSVVVDLGGYQGDFAAAIYERYKTTVHVFEPMPSFFEHCVRRFHDNVKIISHCYGLSASAGNFPITNSANGSSFINKIDQEETLIAEIRAADLTFNALGLDKIDLLKINIEGGEYDVLPCLIDSGWINNIRNIQVQFHNFVPDAENKRNEIIKKLSKTHRQTWCYEFIWENWELID